MQKKREQISNNQFITITPSEWFHPQRFILSQQPFKRIISTTRQVNPNIADSNILLL